MSGPIATAVSAIFGLEASVASFVASIVTGTISGGIQVHDESGLLGRGTGGIVSLASILASVLFWIHMKRMMQLLSNVLLFAAADKIAKLLIILLAKGPPLLHEVRCRTTCNSKNFQETLLKDNLVFVTFSSLILQFDSPGSSNSLGSPAVIRVQGPSIYYQGKKVRTKMFDIDNVSPDPGTEFSWW